MNLKFPQNGLNLDLDGPKMGQKVENEPWISSKREQTWTKNGPNIDLKWT